MAPSPLLAVFIVEDSPTIRQNLVEALEELAPVTVVGTADTAADAITVLADERVHCDLAVVDLLLRNGSGIDVLKALQFRRPLLRRVVLSNYATRAISAHCLALGAERVFDKSAEIESLIDYCNTLADAPR